MQHFMVVSRLDHPLYEAELVSPPKARPGCALLAERQ